jgi:hypothetical protein
MTPAPAVAHAHRPANHDRCSNFQPVAALAARHFAKYPSTRISGSVSASRPIAPIVCAPARCEIERLLPERRNNRWRIAGEFERDEVFRHRNFLTCR